MNVEGFFEEAIQSDNFISLPAELLETKSVSTSSTSPYPEISYVLSSIKQYQNSGVWYPGIYEDTRFLKETWPLYETLFTIVSRIFKLQLLEKGLWERYVLAGPYKQAPKTSPNIYIGLPEHANTQGKGVFQYGRK